ncbi:MAG: pitrilysin family protein [Roseiflexaceae bacterium]|nr:pitrilysin family protein [Roseiflexaceae bacterium]
MSTYPSPPECHVLPGGLRVLIEPVPHARSVSVGCFVGVGAGHEERDESGIAHFVEHMLFKGSQRRPSPKLIADAIEGVGGILDAYTSFELTVYYAKVADIYFDRAIDVLSDMLIAPRFDPIDIEKERRVIAEELHQTEDTPSELVHLLLDAAMWGDQPLGRDIAGSEETIAAFTAEQIVAFWRTHYTKRNMVISIAGHVEAPRALEAVATAFAALPEGAPSACLPSKPPLPGPALTLRRDDNEQGNFCIGFRGVAYNDPDRRALLVLDTVVGNGPSSRLFQEIREERGLAYHIGSYSREHHDTGKWVIFGSVDPPNLEECLATVMAELRHVRDEGITADELAQVKEQVKGGILLSLEDTWAIASRNGSHQLRYGCVIPIEQVVAEVETVSREDVLRVAQRVLRNEHLHVAVIGPHEDAAGLEKLLTVE